MSLVKNLDNSFGVVFPSEVDESDQSPSVAFCIGIPSRIIYKLQLQQYLENAKINMAFYLNGETITVDAKINFPTVIFNISKFVQEKPLLFRIEELNENIFELRRPSFLKSISRISLKEKSFYKKNFKSSFISIKYQGNSPLIKSDLIFIILSPLDVNRYSKLYSENKILPIGATLKFAAESIESLFLNKESGDFIA
jgi:hypothetical protein